MTLQTVQVGSLLARAIPGMRELRSFEGFAIDPEGFEGWDDGVDPRRETTSRPNADGDYDLPSFQGSRTVTISGWCRALSAARLQHFGDQLTGLFSDNAAKRITVQREGAALWADARLALRPEFAVRRGAKFVADWRLPMFCHDPRKYGPENVFGPSVTVEAFHRGNAPAAPSLLVAGSAAAGYTIAGPAGRSFVVTQALVAGQPHTIDMTTGYLTVAGVVSLSGVSRAQTWMVPAGQKVPMTVSLTSGAATLTATVLDTFI